MKNKIQYIHTLEDVCREAQVNPSGSSTPVLNTLVVVNLGVNIDFISFNLQSDNVIIKLWKKLYNRYLSSGVLFMDEENYQVTQTVFRNKAKDWFRKLISLMDSTYDKYKILIDSYEAQKTHMMDKVKREVSNNTRFNDTPQNSGEFDDDPYTTNITQFASMESSDFNTPAYRLKEIQDNLSNIWLEWLNEFSGLFIEELNYQEI